MFKYDLVVTNISHDRIQIHTIRIAYNKDLMPSSVCIKTELM